MRSEPCWYFAYGANMSPQILARRGVRPLSSRVGELRDYKLCFSHRGIFPTEPAFANIEPEVGANLYGVLHQLEADQLTALDKIEGAEYQHVNVQVFSDGELINARAYMDPYPARGLHPSRRYAHIMIEAAQHHGLPQPYLQRLIEQPTCYIPIASEVTTWLSGLAESVRRAGARPELLRMRRLGQQPREHR